MTRTAAVLAGGMGTRLRSLVATTPKSMAAIGNRPFLDILLQSLAQNGFERVILCGGYHAEHISGHFGAKHQGMSLHYLVEKQPLGTGGAARLAMSACDEDHLFVFNGDTFIDIDRAAVETQWAQHRNPVIVGYEVADCARYGSIVVSDGRVTGFREKGALGPGLINAGCYVLNQGQLDEFSLYQPFSLETDYWLRAVQQVSVDLFVTHGRFIDIGVPEDYIRAQHYLSQLPSAAPSPNDLPSRKNDSYKH